MASYQYDDRLTIQENRKRASAVHQEFGPAVRDGNLFLFPDGALFEINPMAHVQEPNTRNRDHPDYAPRVILRYWQVRTQRAEQEFLDLQDRCRRGIYRQPPKGGGFIPPPPTDADLTKLELIRSEVFQCRAGLQAAERRLNPHEPELNEEQVAARERRIAEENAEVQRQLDAIERVTI